jgi:hypothetical protein
MTREIVGALAVGLVAVVVLLVYLSNRSVRRAQEQVIPKPADALNDLHPHDAYYVSTVFAEKALTRVWAHGLGGRGKAYIAISPEGISVSRQGEAGFLIPTRNLTGVSRASATIDKAVERDGLLVLLWTLGADELATHLRIVNHEKRKVMESLITEATGVKIG